LLKSLVDETMVNGKLPNGNGKPKAKRKTKPKAKAKTE
jgi:hypothetical protein